MATSLREDCPSQGQSKDFRLNVSSISSLKMSIYGTGEDAYPRHGLMSGAIARCGPRARFKCHAKHPIFIHYDEAVMLQPCFWQTSLAVAFCLLEKCPIVLPKAPPFSLASSHLCTTLWTECAIAGYKRSLVLGWMAGQAGRRRRRKKNLFTRCKFEASS